VTSGGTLEIRPLDASTWDSLAGLFEQGGDPKWCWCSYFVVRGLDWSNSTPDGNRERLRARMDAAGPTDAPGLVALRDGAAVGWVSLGPRVGFGRLASSKMLAPVDDAPVWSIVCFVVGRRARGQGVASTLLEAAIEHARAAGATMLEAYPVDPGEARIPAANAYHGTLSMFRRAGFSVVATRQANGAARPRIIVRREIG
jgi:GNAT superfamily N-acetyltransferase